MFAPRIDGIDVYHGQGVVDWPTVKTACHGAGWAACKASQGIRFRDPTLDINRAGIAAAGFRYRGLYHWLSPNVDPIVQAQYFLACIGGNLGPNEFAMCDAEEAGITADQTLVWCQTVEAVTRRPVAVYTGVYTAGGSLWRDLRIFDGQRARVLAAYTTETEARALADPYGFDVWQSDGGATGTCPGVIGPCDLDYVENPIMFEVACGITTIPTVPPQPQEEDMALPIVTNAEQLYDSAPGVAKFALMDDGTLRHLGEDEWIVRGSVPGVPWTNAQISAAGAWAPPVPVVQAVQKALAVALTGTGSITLSLFGQAS